MKVPVNGHFLRQRLYEYTYSNVCKDRLPKRIYLRKLPFTENERSMVHHFYTIVRGLWMAGMTSLRTTM